MTIRTCLGLAERHTIASQLRAPSVRRATVNQRARRATVNPRTRRVIVNTRWGAGRTRSDLHRGATQYAAAWTSS
jgi:hypothetical protein